MAKDTYTLYWCDGKREVIHGETIEQAMSQAGYGGSAPRALRALYFWQNGEGGWIWDEKSRRWFKS